MKRILRHFLVEALALFAVISLADGMVFEKPLETFFLASGAITVATMFGKPVINIMLLPLNLITFGLFRWVSSAVALYIVTLVIEGFSIEKFAYAGLDTKWVAIPEVSFTGILAFIAFSFLLSFITSFIHWVRK